MEIHVLRLSHRLPRDERISTHVALVARAFGAGGMTYTGQHDSSLEDSVKRICSNWGGNFPVNHEKSYRKVISSYKKKGFEVIHLTMYGIPVKSMKKPKKALLIVGSEHVPTDVYEMSDQNISVTSQPHSEVAALAIALERLNGMDHEFNGKIKILPSGSGKHVVKTNL